MKVEWLNAEKTRAIVTKGWFRKRWAEVARHSDAWWHFVANGERVPNRLDRCLDSWRARAQYVSPWQPTVSLPATRLLTKEPPCA